MQQNSSDLKNSNDNSSEMELNKSTNQQSKSLLDQQLNKSNSNSNNKPNNQTSRSHVTSKSHISAVSHKYEKKSFHTRNNTYSHSKRNNLIDGVDDSELADDLETGSKKKNLAHLVNFRLTPREQQPFEHEQRKFWSTKIERNSYFTKEQYLQANCNFIVNSNGGDYISHFYDPDLLVDWDKIEEIHLNSQESPTCPICLYPPVAAKMTKCGHIFCWSCVLHYLALSDKTWRKCPICFESIYKQDLKSTRITQLKEFKIGDTIELDLMFKQKSNTIVLPVSLMDEYNRDKPKSLRDFNKTNYNYSTKFMKLRSASPEYIKNYVILREKDELNIQMAQEKEQPESCFINEALTLLKAREDLYSTGLVRSSSKIEERKNENVITPTVITQKNEKPKVTYTDAFDDIIESELDKKSIDSSSAVSSIESIEESKEVSSEQQSLAQSLPSSALANDDSFSYFYQSQDGQRIYMNSLNIRCLISEYKSIVNCPKTLKAKIVAVEHIFMNADLRKRFKYLSHLPLHSEFQIVELDLQEPLISKDTLAQFYDEIESRRKQRLKKEKIENRMLNRSQAEHDRFYTNYSAETYIRSATRSISENLIVDYVQDFPEIKQQQQSKREQTQSTSSSLNNDSSILSATSPPVTTSSFSFAQMVRQEVAAVDQWPKLQQSTSKPQVNSVWGKSVVSQASSTITASNIKNKPSGESDDDENAKPPEYKDTFFSAIDTALKSINKTKSETSESTSDATQTKIEKKKKKKGGHLLFST